MNERMTYNSYLKGSEFEAKSWIRLPQDNV
jgi:hypothetical protein